MNTLFNKVKKLQHKHLHELALMCGSMALLILAAGFVANGGIERAVRSMALSGAAPSSQTAAIFPCSWFGDCGYASQSVYGVTANTTSVAAGQPVTLTWYAYSVTYGYPSSSCMQGYPYDSSHNCSLTGVGPVGTQCAYTPESSVENCTTDSYGIPTCTTTITPANPCSNMLSAAPSGSAVVYPSVTTTYSFCGTRYYGTRDGSNFGGFPYPTPCPSVTITVPTPTPTTLVSFTASPASVTSGTASTLSWTGTKGTNFSACQLAGGQWGSGTWFTTHPGSVATNPLTADTTYQMNCFDTTGASTGWKSATVSVVQPLGPCNDIPPATTVPNGCVSPSPAPGICIPSGGSYSSTANACSCPAGQHVEGTTCVADPLCSNGLNDSYAPSCTCPSGQYQPLGVSSCITLPICTNGLSQAYSPSCACPAGEVQVAGGSTCTLAGVINSLTVNPTRVRKGNSATVSWNTTAMTSCALRGPASGATATLSTALSGSVNVVVTSQLIYRLECLDASGASRSSSATVNLIPEVIEQ